MVSKFSSEYHKMFHFPNIFSKFKKKSVSKSVLNFVICSQIQKWFMFSFLKNSAISNFLFMYSKNVHVFEILFRNTGNVALFENMP